MEAALYDVWKEVAAKNFQLAVKCKDFADECQKSIGHNMVIFCTTNVERLKMPNTYRNVLLTHAAFSWGSRLLVEEGTVSCRPSVERDDDMVLYRRTYDLICDQYSGSMPLRFVVAKSC